MNRPTSHTRAHRAPASTQPGSDDTREKVLKAAEEMFAERGFHGATVREICLRAGANVAAVNYYFGDKLNLYTEVLRRFVRTLDVEAALADRTASPEELLRTLIRMRLRSVFASEHPDWPFRVLLHEWVQPTPAMDRVANETLRPMYDRLRGIVGAILGVPPDDEKTRLCVHSIIGQAIHYIQGRPILARMWPELEMTPAQVDRIADHIADFSLAYLRQFKSEHRRAAPVVRGRERT
ncbi:MAG TPA: CerR family C-terminal domain-containing protein [bacterium]|nr:CerR family C-terminal domain-containing protein [bacterium]